jgi:hypothetical protein
MRGKCSFTLCCKDGSWSTGGAVSQRLQTTFWCSLAGAEREGKGYATSVLRKDSNEPNASERLLKHRYSSDYVRTGEVPESPGQSTAGVS